MTSVGSKREPLISESQSDDRLTGVVLRTQPASPIPGAKPGHREASLCLVAVARQSYPRLPSGCIITVEK